MTARRILIIQGHPASDSLCAGLASAALLPREAKLAEALACILGGHHGYIVRSGERKHAAPNRESPEWRAARRALLGDYLAAQGLDASAVPDGEFLETRLDAALWLAGLVSVADWIGSNDAFFPYAGRPPPGPAYWQDARIEQIAAEFARRREALRPYLTDRKSVV